MKNLSLTTILCGICKSNLVAENIEEVVIVNAECNIDQNARSINGKSKSYGIILRNVYFWYHCRRSRGGIKRVKGVLVDT